MTQEIGETTDAIMGDVSKKIEKIVNLNKNRTEPYWIVIFAKPARGTVHGKRALVQHVKPYSTKPNSQVGMIIGKVDNKLSNIQWEINMPDAPIAWNKLSIIGAKEGTEIITDTTTIGQSYLSAAG
jgi:hypothetical protein